MTDNYPYLIFGLLIYFAIAAILLLVLGFNGREDQANVVVQEEPIQPDEDL
jgi:hypothetical protein